MPTAAAELIPPNPYAGKSQPELIAALLNCRFVLEQAARGISVEPEVVIATAKMLEQLADAFELVNKHPDLKKRLDIMRQVAAHATADLLQELQDDSGPSK